MESLTLTRKSNGLHPTTSTRDPNRDPHVTVRLSNAGLRQQNSWYTLHWCPNVGSVVPQHPDNLASQETRRAKSKQKKQKRQGKKWQDNDKDKDGKDEDSARGKSQGAGIRGWAVAAR